MSRLLAMTLCRLDIHRWRCLMCMYGRYLEQCADCGKERTPLLRSIHS